MNNYYFRKNQPSRSGMDVTSFGKSAKRYFGPLILVFKAGAFRCSQDITNSLLVESLSTTKTGDDDGDAGEPIIKD